MVDQLRWTTIEHAVSFPPAGGHITCRTDRPVTLTMQWSTIPWRMHMHTELKRGRLFIAYPYYCFVQYTLEAQKEEGDTMSHTFTLPDWPVLEYRVWHFTGTVAGRNSPSSSPLFSAIRQPSPAAAPLSAHPIIQLVLHPWAVAAIRAATAATPAPPPPPVLASFSVEQSPWHIEPSPIKASHTGVIT